MNITYHRDQTTAYQTIKAHIAVNKETVWDYIATSRITEWFPQLSYTENEKGTYLVFNMGNSPDELMRVTAMETYQQLTFDWGHGYVELELHPADDGTQLVLNETMPLTFNVAQDFIGWKYQVQNIKHICETGQMLPLHTMDFPSEEAALNVHFNL